MDLMIVEHFARSLAGQAGARPVSQPPTPTGRPLAGDTGQRLRPVPVPCRVLDWAGGIFPRQSGTFALLAAYHRSDGTGKPAVAYQAARSNARAAFCVSGRGPWRLTLRWRPIGRHMTAGKSRTHRWASWRCRSADLETKTAGNCSPTVGPDLYVQGVSLFQLHPDEFAPKCFGEGIRRKSHVFEAASAILTNGHREFVVIPRLRVFPGREDGA
jgi:hypothetical protein